MRRATRMLPHTQGLERTEAAGVADALKSPPRGFTTDTTRWNRPGGNSRTAQAIGLSDPSAPQPRSTGGVVGSKASAHTLSGPGLWDTKRTLGESDAVSTVSAVDNTPQSAQDLFLESGPVPEAVRTHAVMFDSADETRLSVDAVVQLDMLAFNVARGATLCAAEGLPLPAVRATGYAYAPVAGVHHFGRALRRGEARADNVRGAFVRLVGEHLRALGSTMEAESVSIVGESRGTEHPHDIDVALDDVEARHRVVVAVAHMPSQQAIDTFFMSPASARGETSALNGTPEGQFAAFAKRDVEDVQKGSALMGEDSAPSVGMGNTDEEPPRRVGVREGLNGIPHAQGPGFEQDLPGRVAKRLVELNGSSASAETVMLAHGHLVRSRGARYTRMDLRARVEAVAFYLADIEFRGVRGGAALSKLGVVFEEGVSASGGPSGSGQPRAVGSTLIEQEQDRRRPPWIDHEMPSPPAVMQPVRFSDGAQLPSYMAGGVAAGGPEPVRLFALGAGEPRVRGVDLVLRELGYWLEGAAGIRPAPVKGPGARSRLALLDSVEADLRSDPRDFIGHQRSLLYKTADGNSFRLHWTASVNYSYMERFKGSATKIDSMQRNSRASGNGVRGGKVWRVGLAGPLSFAGVTPIPWVRPHVEYHSGKWVRNVRQSQVVNQTETRTSDPSHVHLASVGYEFRITDRSGRPVDVRGRSIEADRVNQEAAVLRFVVRDGFSVRLPESVTSAASESHFPPEIPMRNGFRIHHAIVEGVGLSGDIVTKALTVADVFQGTPGAEQVTQFVSPSSMSRMARALLAGPVMSPVIYGGKFGTEPRGVLQFRSRPVRLTRLNGSTTAAEMRDVLQSAVQTEQTIGSESGGEIGLLLGLGGNIGLPAVDSILRGHLALVGAAGYRGEQQHTARNNAGRKSAAQAKGAETQLYLMEQELTITGPPRVKAPSAGPAVNQSGHQTLRKNAPQLWALPPVSETTRIVSLVRLTLPEAQRAAGLDYLSEPTRTGLVPLFVTADSLGTSRVEDITFDDGGALRPIPREHQHAAETSPAQNRPTESFAEHITRIIVNETSRAYPNLIAPLDQLHPDNPRWGGGGNFQIVLNNTIELFNQLSHQSLTSNLESMMGEGMRIKLLKRRAVKDEDVFLVIRAELSDVVHLGSKRGQQIRSSTPGSEGLSIQRSRARSTRVGLEGVGALRSNAPGTAGIPLQTETLSIGPRFARRTESESVVTTSGSQDNTLISKASEHFQYTLSFRVGVHTASKPSPWINGLTAGVLQTVGGIRAERLLIGTDAPSPGGVESLSRGRVVLSVPADHTRTDGPAGGVERHEGEIPLGVTARDMAHRTPRWLEHITAQDPFTSRPSRGSLQMYPVTAIDFAHKQELGTTVQDVLNRATGGSKLVMGPGAPGHQQTVERLLGTSLVADVSTMFSPLGQRWTVVTPAVMDRETLIVRQATVDLDRRVTILVPPHKMEAEGAIGGALQASRRNGKTSSVSLMARLNIQRSLPGTAETLGLGLGFHKTWYSSEAFHLRAGRTTTRKDSGYQVALAVPVNVTVAALSSLFGVGPRRLPWPEPGNAISLHSDTLMVSLPANAELTGMAPNPYGPMPRYDSIKWEPPEWLRQVPFGSWPVNSLNPAQVLTNFEHQARRQHLSDQDIEHLRWLVSDRVARALDGEMTGAGVSLPVRIGRWGSQALQLWIGSRQVGLRVQLIPTDQVTFLGLGHSVEMEENLYAEEVDQRIRGNSFGFVAGVIATAAIATSDPVIKSAGPLYAQSGSSTGSSMVTKANTKISGSFVTHTQIHGAVAQQYRLRVSLEAVRDGQVRTVAEAEADAGFQVKHYPAALLSALGNDDVLRPRALPPASTPRRVPLPRSMGAGGWQDVDGSGPFEVPKEGFAVRGIHGLQELRSGITLALGAAYDLSVRVPMGAIEGNQLRALLGQAKKTPFTRIGSTAERYLDSLLTDMAMAALTPKMLTQEGRELLLEAPSIFGNDHASVGLWARPHLPGAQLLACEYGIKFETVDQNVHGNTSGGAHSGGSDQALDAGPTSTTAVGTGYVGSSLGARAATSVISTQSIGTTGSVNIKPSNSEMAYLVAIPLTVLIQAAAQRAIGDSDVMVSVRRTFHGAQRVPHAVEVDTHALVWMTRKVAEQIGLFSDSDAPVHHAAEEGKKATAAFIAGAKQYEDLVHVDGAQAQTALEQARELLRGLERSDADSRPGVEEARAVIQSWEEGTLPRPKGAGTTWRLTMLPKRGR